MLSDTRNGPNRRCQRKFDEDAGLRRWKRLRVAEGVEQNSVMPVRRD